MFKPFVELNRYAASFSTLIGKSIRKRHHRSVKQSQQIAHLFYRVEQLSNDTDALKDELSERWTTFVEEKLASDESARLKFAVAAAKQGANPQFIAEKYGLFEAEAELIVAVHGTHHSPTKNKLH